MRTWFVYLLQGRRGQLYCGITLDLERRLWEHNNNHQRASRCAWACRPLELVWSLAVEDRRAASKLEARIKRLPRLKKLELVKGSFQLGRLDI